MNQSVIRKTTLQEQELEQKKAELASLETELAQRELDLATLYTEVRAYDYKYLTPISIKRAELERIEAEIAQVLADLNPEDDTAQAEAREAFERAAEAAERSSKTRAGKATEAVEADEDLRALFREAAKKFHPDLANDEAERERRNGIMAEVNRAYQDGDAAELRVVIDKWEREPDVIQREGVGAYLVRVKRKIARVRGRLREIDGLMKKGARIHKAIPKGEQAKAAFDLRVAAMVEKLDRAIADARKRLEGQELRMRR